MAGIWVEARKVTLQADVGHNFVFTLTRNISIRKDNLQIITQCSPVNKLGETGYPENQNCILKEPERITPVKESSDHKIS